MARKSIGLPVLVLALASVSTAQTDVADDCVKTLISAAVERTNLHICYDGSYRQISYPGGDVPETVGVCTDLVIRSYRKLGVDLQKEVHEDMKRAFSQYPNTWGSRRPDPNIDHRRVANLRTFLGRHGLTLSASENPHDYLPGDLVTWSLPGGLSHIGIVGDQRTADGKRPLIVHNIGRGPEVEDMLLDYPITGHYRYIPCPGRGEQSD